MEVLLQIPMNPLWEFLVEFSNDILEEFSVNFCGIPCTTPAGIVKELLEDFLMKLLEKLPLELPEAFSIDLLEE